MQFQPTFRTISAACTRENATPRAEGRRQHSLSRWLVALTTGLLLILAHTGTATAAEFGGGQDVYVLPEGEVIEDDLYVAAGEVLINGTVEGDLLAAGGYVEINGAVNGSVMAAGAGIRINGVVQNSVRAAGMSIIHNGTVRKDFIATGGGIGGPGFGGSDFGEFPIPVGERMLTPGLQLTANSSVAGDAVLSGSSAQVGGIIGGDLLATAGRVVLGGNIAGAANVQAAQFEVLESAQIEGVLTITGPEQVDVGEGVASEVVVVPQSQPETTDAPDGANPLLAILGWLWRMAIQLIGLALIAWLIWAFFPNLIDRPTAAIEARPVESGLYGFVAFVAIVPLALALIFLGILFWGWFPGGVSFSAAAFGLLSIGWLLSPVFIGLWAGRRMVDAIGLDANSPLRGNLQSLLLGALSIALVAHIVSIVPCAGPIAERIIYLLCFALALGGLLITRIRPVESGGATPGDEMTPA